VLAASYAMPSGVLMNSILLARHNAVLFTSGQMLGKTCLCEIGSEGRYFTTLLFSSRDQATGADWLELQTSVIYITHTHTHTHPHPLTHTHTPTHTHTVQVQPLLLAVMILPRAGVWLWLDCNRSEMRSTDSHRTTQSHTRVAGCLHVCLW